MKVGLGIMPVPPLPMASGFVAQAEAGGLDGVFVPDRIMSWFPRALWGDVGNIAAMMPSPHVFLDPFTTIAAWSQTTSRIRFATSVSDPIRHAPAQLAVTALTLSLLTQGRFILGLGCGEVANLVPYGLPGDALVSRLEEALRVIRHIWSRSEDDLDGKFWALRDAVCDVEPYAGVHPEIWLGAHGPRMLDLTGTYADGWLPFMPFTPEEYAVRLGRVRAAAERAGRDPSAIVAGLNAPVCIADDHDTAHAMMASAAARQFLLVMPDEFWRELGLSHPLGIEHSVTEFIPEAIPESRLRAALAQVPDPLIAHDYIIHGTPEEVADQLRAFEEAGLEYFAPLDTSPLTDLASLPGSIDRLVRVASLVDPTFGKPAR